MGGDAKGQKGKKSWHREKLSHSHKAADTPPMLRKMALLTLEHLQLRIFFNTWGIKGPGWILKGPGWLIRALFSNSAKTPALNCCCTLLEIGSQSPTSSVLTSHHFAELGASRPRVGTLLPPTASKPPGVGSPQTILKEAIAAAFRRWWELGEKG